ncbi:MAG: pilus assembly protein TadG-related protein [Armatimonadota bacterium]|nr:pilus assembly protein TadG-related protein [Armatimonadota bacterium]
MKHLRRNNTGSVLVFVAVSLVALIGMAALAVDVGRLYAAKTRAQDICDAAAIAGAYQLNGTADAAVLADATATTNRSASDNDESRSGWPVYNSASVTGGTQGTVNVSFPLGDDVTRDDGSVVTVDDNGVIRKLLKGEAIRVKGWVEVQYGLANIFGGATASRSGASAIAVRVYSHSVTSQFTVPIALSDKNFDDETPDDNLHYGETETLTYSRWQEYDGLLGSGNFGLLDIAETNTQDGIKQLLAFNAGPVALSVGDERLPQPGGPVGLIDGGISDRLTYSATHTDTPFDTEYNDTTLDTMTIEEGGQSRTIEVYNFDDWVADGMPLDSRIMIAPVIHDVDITGGSTRLEIVGFAAFFVDQYANVQGDRVITAIFVQAVLGGSGTPWIIPGLNPGDPVDPGTSILEVKLIK